MTINHASMTVNQASMTINHASRTINHASKTVKEHSIQLIHELSTCFRLRSYQKCRENVSLNEVLATITDQFHFRRFT